MKTPLFVIFFFFTSGYFLSAQQQMPMRSKAKMLTGCADNFMKSLTELAFDVNIKNCRTTPDSVHVVFGEMTNGCYGGTDNKTARVTYAMFRPANGLPTADRGIRVIWSGKKSVYDYYNVCTPPNLVYQLPEATENHVFEAFLIPISAYKSLTGASAKSYSDLKKSALPRNYLKNIQSVSVEPRTGYIAATEPALYNNNFSSKGIVVHIKLSATKFEDCYLINNYDTAGTVIWKQ